MSSIWIGQFLLTGAFPSMKYKRLFFLKFNIFTLLTHLLHSEGKMMQCSFYSLLFKALLERKSVCFRNVLSESVWTLDLFALFLCHTLLCLFQKVSSKLSTCVSKKKEKKKEEKTNTKQKVKWICSPHHDLQEACETISSNIKTLGLVPLRMCVY